MKHHVKPIAMNLEIMARICIFRRGMPRLLHYCKGGGLPNCFAILHRGEGSLSTRKSEYVIQFTTSSRRLDGGAYCGAPVGGKCTVSKAKLVLYAFAV